MRKKLLLFLIVFCICQQTFANDDVKIISENPKKDGQVYQVSEKSSQPAFYFQFGRSFIANNNKTSIYFEKTISNTEKAKSIVKDWSIKENNLKQGITDSLNKSELFFNDKINLKLLHGKANTVSSCNAAFKSKIEQNICIEYITQQTEIQKKLTDELKAIKQKTIEEIEMLKDKYIFLEKEQITLQQSISNGAHLKFCGQFKWVMLEVEKYFHRLNFKTDNVRKFYIDNSQWMTNVAVSIPIKSRVSHYAGAGLGFNNKTFKIDPKIAQQDIEDDYVIKVGMCWQ